MARAAFLSTEEADALDLKFEADHCQTIEIADERVSARGLRQGAGQLQLALQRLPNLHREERDLPFVVLPVTKKTIATDSASRDTLNCVHRQDRMRVRWLLVVAKVIMAGGDEQMFDTLHS